MKCAYCGKEAKGSKEHIISNSVLDLFPECFLTIDEERKLVYQADPMIKDVCIDCNNKISYIDSYAKTFIEKYFIKKYSKDNSLNIAYDYSLIQKICLKYAFNDLRSKRKDTSFFSEEIIGFLLDKNKNEPLRNVTVLAGLAVNTSPIPDYIFGNMKFRWSDSLVFCENSLVMNIDYDTGKITLRENLEIQRFKSIELSYVFRFNSIQLLLLCWDKDISDADLKENKIILEYKYPYSLLDISGYSKISRCTSEITYHNENIIDVTWGQSIMDEISFMRGTFTEEYKKYMSFVEGEWDKVEKNIAEEHPR